MIRLDNTIVLVEGETYSALKMLNSIKILLLLRLRNNSSVQLLIYHFSQILRFTLWTINILGSARQRRCCVGCKNLFLIQVLLSLFKVLNVVRMKAGLLG